MRIWSLEEAVESVLRFVCDFDGPAAIIVEESSRQTIDASTITCFIVA